VETFAAIATVVLAILTAGTRFIETRRSPAVTGVSLGFAWLGYTSNALWLSYGLRLDISVQIWVSLAWGFVFTYILWRLNNRRITIKFVTLLALIFTASVTLAYALSADAAGWVAGSIICASTFPQAVKIWRTKNPEGVAPIAWIMAFISGLIWILYGYTANLLPVTVLNTINTAIIIVILLGIVRADRYTRGTVTISDGDGV
jgi:uncharacterized protein with PQ loop repeat